jgi:hypothetical protein
MKKSIIKGLFVALLISVFSLGITATGNAQSKNEKDAALELIISSTSRQLPMDYGNGMVNTKLVREGNYLVYYYVCDESKYDIDVMNTRIPSMKAQIKGDLNADGFLLEHLRSACKEAGCGIAYYYVGKKSGKIAKVLIPVSELK